jgi:predicted TPR repeat methyltransferase
MSSIREEKTFNFVATEINFSEDSFELVLANGRTLSVPYDLVPSLSNADKNARENAVLLGMGTGIHWPDLDEDLSVEGLVLGRKIIDWKKGA